MANSKQISNKHQLIAKINKQIVVVASVGIFVFLFCAFAAKDLISTMDYQNQVITAKQDAETKLGQDVVADKSLVKSYEAFVSTPTNIIGGVTSSQIPTGNNGDSSKIILDALPSRYDFPALITSLQYLLTSNGVKLTGIGGTDQQLTVNQAASSNPKPVDMPFTFSVSGSYQSIQNLVGAIQRSIRPIDIQTEDFTGDQNNLTFSVTAQTYFQPEKAFKLVPETIK